MLVLDGLSKHFGAVRAVDNVSVKVLRGQVVGVIGRSGAGKSTLLRLINRLLEATSGRIVWDGTDIMALRGPALRRWRARCAMIFQQFNLVPRLDVLTNVLIGRLGYRAMLPSLVGRFSAEERARAVWALHRLDLVPQALQRADTLSGGQQQRVAIARALVQEPKILLADEPVASLDPANAALVMDALRTINQQDGITVVCNLHSLDLARRYCDRILGVAAGAVVFDGDPGELDLERARAIYGSDREEAGAPAGIPEEVTR
ncbi:MAG TPA: phosphonate ABC transporter ATP-binding protein [Methylomirabilota bacterium]|jgi:phosphonate transport system ATP-binding protein